MSTDAGLRTIWLALEDLHAMKPTPEGRCRSCRAFRAPGPLCLDCNDRRLALKERFRLFPIPADAAETLDDITPAPAGPQQPSMTVNEPTTYRLPYKED